MSAVPGLEACCCVPDTGGVNYALGSCPLMPGQGQPFPWNCAGQSPVLTPQTPAINVGVSYTPKGIIKPTPQFSGPLNIINPHLDSPQAPPFPPASGIAKSLASIYAPPGSVVPPGTWGYEGIYACPRGGINSQPPSWCVNPTPLSDYKISFGVNVFAVDWTILVFDNETGTNVPFHYTEHHYCGLSVAFECKCGIINGAQRHGMVPFVQISVVNDFWFQDLPGVGTGATFGLSTLSPSGPTPVMDPPLGLVVDDNGFVHGGVVTIEGNLGKLTLACTT